MITDKIELFFKEVKRSRVKKHIQNREENLRNVRPATVCC